MQNGILGGVLKGANSNKIKQAEEKGIYVGTGIVPTDKQKFWRLERQSHYQTLRLR